MPYASDAQRRYFHWAKSRRKISDKVVSEFDEASSGKDLPERLHPKIDPKAPKRLIKYTKKEAMLKNLLEKIASNECSNKLKLIFSLGFLTGNSKHIVR